MVDELQRANHQSANGLFEFKCALMDKSNASWRHGATVRSGLRAVLGKWWWRGGAVWLVHAILALAFRRVSQTRSGLNLHSNCPANNTTLNCTAGNNGRAYG